MGEINLFAVASQQAQWLSVRQSAISQNIANANTPGYRAIDVEPFAKTLEQVSLSATQTAGGHIAATSAGGGERKYQTISGNSVSLEQELIKADEVNRAYAVNAGIVKSFHRMLMMSVR